MASRAGFRDGKRWFSSQGGSGVLNCLQFFRFHDHEAPPLKLCQSKEKPLGKGRVDKRNGASTTATLLEAVA